ncbi:MAG TPA: hypothetical protein VMF30_15935 [Pirellulales bacterium]|nr:hypothetical protein [Pirellulales bacterium]
MNVIKAICVVVFLAAAIAGIAVWLKERPRPEEELLRVVYPVVAAASLGVFLSYYVGRSAIPEGVSPAPDYLRHVSQPYFNRDGFCFVVRPRVHDGVCHLVVHFQNRWAGDCEARIALRPARGFWMVRPPAPPVVLNIECGGGAFGVALCPLALPKEVQGKELPFEVGACASFPEGKGYAVRESAGTALGTNSSHRTRVSPGAIAAIIFLGHLGGVVHLFSAKPGRLNLRLPREVAESLPPDVHPSAATLWQLGDPPLESVAADASSTDLVD